jgi:5-methylcytosine-specific restriction endonuclease McrA
VCGKTAIDIHHIEARGIGGSKEADNIENLMALCREDHLKYGDKKQHKEFLKEKHQEKLKQTI